jgi:lipopolysaccharide export system protein LptC
LPGEVSPAAVFPAAFPAARVRALSERIVKGDSLNYNSPIRVPDQRTQRPIGRNAGDRVFRTAARHSRLVRFLRFAIPALIVAIAILLLVAAFFNPFKLITTFPIDPGKVSLSGTKIIMELPRLTGYTTDSRPYEMIARTAAQDLTRPDILELKDIDAKVETKDGQHITIKSINGVYDTKGELLKLKDHIVLTTSSGYEARLSEATVNVASSSVVSERPVDIKLPNNGTLSANRLQVTDNGAVVVFSGGVEMHLNPEQARPAGEPATQESASASTPAQTAPVQTPPMQTTARRSALSP